MEDKQNLGSTFLRLSAASIYGIWIIILSFPLTLAGLSFLIDKNRSTKSLILSSVAIGVIAASYILRFYLVRNIESLRSRVLQAGNHEEALYIILGGFWWCSVTLICSITAVITIHNLY